MPPRFPDVLNLFYQDRPVIAETNTTDYLIQRLVVEVAELQEGPNGSAMGEKKYMEQELADIVIFAWAALHSLSIDPDAAIREKISRNQCKFPSNLFQSNSGLTYDEAMVKSKEQWSDEDNEEFYSPEISA